MTAPAIPLPRGRSRARRFAPVSIASTVLLLVAWQVVSALAGDNGSGEHMVPNVVDVANATERFADYWRGGLGVEKTSVTGELTWQGAVLGLVYNTALTAMHTVTGVALGILAGLGLATAVAWSSVLRAMLATPGHFMRMLPLLAMAPLFALWFGDTHLEAILFTGFVAFSLVFPIALNAIGNVPRYFDQYAASLGASRLRTYGSVVLPAALPELRSGIMLAVGFGWSAAIAVEYIGHEYGLGHVVQNAEYFGRTNVLALVAIIALALAAASFAAASKALGWATRWAE